MRLLLACGLAASLALLTGCPADDDPLGGACGGGFDAETGAVGDFGTGEAALKVEAFLHAAADLYGATADVEGDLLATCTAMATDLGVPAAELEPGAGELAVVAACDRLDEEIDAIVALLPAGVGLSIVATPPSCTVDLDLAATCAAECDVTITGDATVECTGELHGACSATCSGACVVEGTVSCGGRCTGSCSGTCSGVCNGACSGTCSQTDDQGNCVGTCSGTCEGTCDAECSGTCTGTCTENVTATCEGECYGSCSATWDAACNGEANVEADADCQAACEARANATATCTAPAVEVAGVEVPSAADQARIDALVATLIENYPALLQVHGRLQFSLVPALEAFATSAQGAATSLASAGVQAAACLAAAADAVADAAGRIDASFTVTIEVNASVTARGPA